jgi:hypothetical protein
MRAKVYPFPVRVQRTCRGCAAPLPRSAPAWHTRCLNCYRHAAYRKALHDFLTLGRSK